MRQEASSGEHATDSRCGKTGTWQRMRERSCKVPRDWSILTQQGLVKSQISRVNQRVTTLIIVFECLLHFKHVLL